MTKNLSRLRIEGNHFHLINSINKNPSADIIVNGERLNAFPLKSETTQANDVYFPHTYSAYYWKF